MVLCAREVPRFEYVVLRSGIVVDRCLTFREAIAILIRSGLGSEVRYEERRVGE